MFWREYKNLLYTRTDMDKKDMVKFLDIFVFASDGSIWKLKFKIYQNRWVSLERRRTTT